MKRFLVPGIVIALFAVLVGFLYAGLDLNPRTIPSPFIGKPAPALDLPDLHDGSQRVTATAQQGKPWLLNVWGTWCPECWREHRYLLDLSRTGVPIVGVNWRDDGDKARDMLKRYGNPFIAIGFDPDSRAAIDWGVYGAPETFLIDSNGIIQLKHTGALNEQVWQEKFAPYFANRGPRS